MAVRRAASVEASKTINAQMGHPAEEFDRYSL
jgi:hypothetical protein